MESRYDERVSEFVNLYAPDLLLLIAITAVFAGMVKGIVGFAMPMIFITGMTVFISPDLALGILILPTLVTNGWQAGRQGFAAAYRALYDHRWFLGMGYSVLLVTTQMVPLLSQSAVFPVSWCAGGGLCQLDAERMAAQGPQRHWPVDWLCFGCWRWWWDFGRIGPTNSDVSVDP